MPVDSTYFQQHYHIQDPHSPKLETPKPIPIITFGGYQSPLSSISSSVSSSISTSPLHKGVSSPSPVNIIPSLERDDIRSLFAQHDGRTTPNCVSREQQKLGGTGVLALHPHLSPALASFLPLKYQEREQKSLGAGNEDEPGPSHTKQDSSEPIRKRPRLDPIPDPWTNKPWFRPLQYGRSVREVALVRINRARQLVQSIPEWDEGELRTLARAIVELVCTDQQFPGSTTEFLFDLHATFRGIPGDATSPLFSKLFAEEIRGVFTQCWNPAGAREPLRFLSISPHSATYSTSLCFFIGHSYNQGLLSRDFLRGCVRVLLRTTPTFRGVLGIEKILAGAGSRLWDEAVDREVEVRQLQEELMRGFEEDSVPVDQHPLTAAEYRLRRKGVSASLQRYRGVA